MHTCLSFTTFAGVLVFNPVTYVIIVWIGWKLTFGAFAVIMAVVGIPLALTFADPKTKDPDKNWKLTSELQTIGEVSVDSEPRAGYAPLHEDSISSGKKDTRESEAKHTPIPIAKKTKIIIGSLWLLVSLLKSWAYFTPYIILVS